MELENVESNATQKAQKADSWLQNLFFVTLLNSFPLIKDPSNCPFSSRECYLSLC